MQKTNFCICIEVYKIHEGDVYDKTIEILSTINKKKVNKTLIAKYKDMLEISDFEQHYCSRTAMGGYKIGHDSFRLWKWLVFYDRSFYEDIYYYELMGSISKYFNEKS